MSTLWLNRSPGQVIADNSEQVRRDPMEDAMMVVGVDHPDWVAVPDETPHGDAGRRLRVAQQVDSPCPTCGGPAVHFVLRDSELRVAECAACQVFTWYSVATEKSKNQGG